MSALQKMGLPNANDPITHYDPLDVLEVSYKISKDARMEAFKTIGGDEAQLFEEAAYAFKQLLKSLRHQIRMICDTYEDYQGHQQEDDRRIRKFWNKIDKGINKDIRWRMRTFGYEFAFANWKLQRDFTDLLPYLKSRGTSKEVEVAIQLIINGNPEFGKTSYLGVGNNPGVVPVIIARDYKDCGFTGALRYREAKEVSSRSRHRCEVEASRVQNGHLNSKVINAIENILRPKLHNTDAVDCAISYLHQLREELKRIA